MDSEVDFLIDNGHCSASWVASRLRVQGIRHLPQQNSCHIGFFAEPVTMAPFGIGTSAAGLMRSLRELVILASSDSSPFLTGIICVVFLSSDITI
jgi:hypothetical protein